MEMIKLNNGIEMPILGYGTFQVTDPKVCEDSVAFALQNGYRLIDTAQAYGNEEAVGAGIKKSGVSREEIFLTTKVWFHSYESGDCRKSVLESMQKLGVDYLDMVLLHWPFGNTYAAWRDLEKLYEEGKIRAIGISNFDPDRMIDFIKFNKFVPAINQIETHLFCQRQEEHEWMDKYKVSHQAYAPLGQGHANEMFEKNEVKAIAAKYGKTPAQVLLRFLTQCGVAVIPKSVHEERIKENINIFDFTMTEEELNSLRALDTAEPMIGKAESPETVEFAMTW
ncbi:MAG: aldo/keto reductase [Eubacteriales bacterium]|nr:aldo/keto reductase [Eubacteriales bacterium]